MMPNNRHEPAGRRAGRGTRPSSALGKDEMNLAEFPITLLTDRVPKGQKVIQYQDKIFDERPPAPSPAS